MLDFERDNSISKSTETYSKEAIGYVQIQTPSTLEIEVKGLEKERIFSFSKSDQNVFVFFGLLVATFVLPNIIAVTGLAFVIWGIIRVISSGRGSVAPEKSIREENERD